MTSVEIIDYAPPLQADFERLNREWIEQFFAMEELDRQILSDPQRTIIAPGGAVIFARLGANIVGTCALKNHGEGVFELTKLAVTASAQGRGIGRRLVDATVARHRQLGGTRLFLESHASLDAALKLYQSAGFVDAPRPAGPSHYSRCNVFMEYRD